MAGDGSGAGQFGEEGGGGDDAASGDLLGEPVAGFGEELGELTGELGDLVTSPETGSGDVADDLRDGAAMGVAPVADPGELLERSDRSESAEGGGPLGVDLSEEGSQLVDVGGLGSDECFSAVDDHAEGFQVGVVVPLMSPPCCCCSSYDDGVTGVGFAVPVPAGSGDPSGHVFHFESVFEEIDG